jgi:hypothetical protein
MLISCVLMTLALVGCGAGHTGGAGGGGAGGTASGQPPTPSHPPPPAHLPASRRPAHIAVIVMENHEYSEIIGSGSAHYVNGLASQYALATRSFAITHPSLPNYLALTGGSTFGITDDCTDCSVPGSGLGGQLSSKRITWKAYMEDMPRPCFTGADAGGYAKKHDPFVYYRELVANASRCANVVPLTQLQADERAHRLPAFTWISPNLCHDMHDCDVSAGDRFLSQLIPPLLGALGRTGLLVLTWDEGSSDAGCCRVASGGHIATILAGGAARARARLNTPVDHYSVLQTIEDLLGVPRLGAAACPCTRSLQPLLARR